MIVTRSTSASSYECLTNLLRMYYGQTRRILPKQSPWNSFDTPDLFYTFSKRIRAYQNNCLTAQRMKPDRCTGTAPLRPN